MRTACVIAVSKAREAFEPFVHQLGYRLAHVLRRLLPVAMFLLQVRGGLWLWLCAVVWGAVCEAACFSPGRAACVLWVVVFC